MNVTISNPVRALALVGVLAVLGLGIALFNVSRHSSSPAAPVAVTTPPAATTTTAAVAPKPAAKPAKPKVELLPGLPAQVAKALRASKTAVVTLYTGGGSDAAAVAEARAGAHAAHTYFVRVNVLHARNAADLAAFAGSPAAPLTLVVRRPGKIVGSLAGVQDRQVVEQAARDAR
jgi:hypothetical protein